MAIISHQNTKVNSIYKNLFLFFDNFSNFSVHFDKLHKIRLPNLSNSQKCKLSFYY